MKIAVGGRSQVWAVLLFVVCVFGSVSNKAPLQQFGHSLLSQFMLEEGYVNLNHGSYGAPPRAVMEVERNWTAQMELNPDRWFRYLMFDQLSLEREVVAKYLGVNSSDIVFVINASNGVNAVLRSIIFQQNTHKKVLYLNTAYGMVKNTLNYVHNTFGESLIEANITFPTSNESILKTVREALDANPEVALASISHITSIPSIVLPVYDIIQLCHSRNVLVLIDGAHAMGQIPLNISQIGADFYITNGHKWMYTTKGSAVLWVAPALQDLVFPTVISQEGQGNTPYQLDFSYVGTMDYSSFLTFSSAISFRESLGGDSAIMSYIHQLALDGGALLAREWQTEVLQGNDTDMIPAMVNVRLPDSVNSTLAATLPTTLLLNYNTWVPVYPLQGQFWTRVSAQVYNEISDFQYLADAINQIVSN